MIQTLKTTIYSYQNYQQMYKRRIQIYSERQCDQTFLFQFAYLDTQVDDAVINEIIDNPESAVIQISDYISENTLRKLNVVFVKRPDIQFRVYGRRNYPDFDGWNLQFLSLLPAVERLSIDSFECLDSDFEVLQSLSGLKELRMEVFNIKDYSFVKILPVQIENLTIIAEMKSGRAKFDCNWLLRLPLLHTLFLGKIDKNLESIIAFDRLRNLTLQGVGVKDLSFLKQLRIESLTISWCNVNKIDWNSLRDFSTIRYLKLFSIKKMDDISFITTLPRLEKLELIWMGAVVRLPDLSCLENLNEVYIDTANKLEDVSGLVGVKSLKIVEILNSKSITNEAVNVLMKNQSIEKFLCYGRKSDIKIGY